jgi:hypothetical protein
LAISASEGRGERMTSSPTLRISTSSVANRKPFGRRDGLATVAHEDLGGAAHSGTVRNQDAIYESYMAPRAQYVRLPGPLSGSSGSGGSRSPVSSLFSTGGRSPNPTLSANSSLRSALAVGWSSGIARRAGSSRLGTNPTLTAKLDPLFSTT